MDNLHMEDEDWMALVILWCIFALGFAAGAWAIRWKYGL